MKKYILGLVVLSLFTFSVKEVSASDLTTAQISGVAQILRVLSVSENDINKIVTILKSNTDVKQYNSNTGQEIIPTPPKVFTGCEDNNKYNIKTGQPCPDYKAPPVPTNQNNWGRLPNASA